MKSYLKKLIVFIIIIGTFYIISNREQVDNYNVDITPTPAQEEEKEEEKTETIIIVQEEPKMLDDVIEIYNQNIDLHAWIQLDALDISLPIVYTPDDYDKYLRMDFEGNPSAYGTLFLQATTGINDNHTIIFGHNTKNGSYFGGLKKYRNQEYLEENSVFFISDLYQVYEYEIVAAVLDTVHMKDDPSFKYYYYTDNSGYDFDDFYNWVKTNAVSVNHLELLTEDAKIVQMITCSPHTEDGRCIIIAVRR